MWQLPVNAVQLIFLQIISDNVCLQVTVLCRSFIAFLTFRGVAMCGYTQSICIATAFFEFATFCKCNLTMSFIL